MDYSDNRLRQVTASKKQPVPKIPTIGQVLETKNPKSVSRSKCKCGAEIKPFVIAGSAVYRQVCSDCAAASNVQERRELLRESRTKKAAWMRRTLHRVVPPLFEKARLSHFSDSFVQIALDLDDYTGLLLWGEPGVGKSYFMAAVLRSYFLKKNCQRITYEKLCRNIRESYNNESSDSESTIICRLIAPELLVLDDLGTTKSIGQAESDFSSRTILSVLDERMELCKKTYITSNKSPENLGLSFGDRIASRLKTFKIIHMTGKDKRAR